MSRREKEDVLCNVCGQHISWFFPVETSDGKMYHRDCYNHMQRLFDELAWFEDNVNSGRKIGVGDNKDGWTYEIIEAKGNNVIKKLIEDAGGQPAVEGAVEEDSTSAGKE